MRIAYAIAILGIGYMMTFLLFPWLDELKATYRPTSLVMCDSVNTGDALQIAISGDDWALQKFEAGSSYKVYCVELKLWLEAVGAGTLEVRIYNADATGEPTGNTLASSTLSGSAMTTVAPGDWETVYMMPQYGIVSGEEYVIQLRYTPVGSEWVNWRVNPSYLGDFAYSEDGGDTWTHGSLPG